MEREYHHHHQHLGGAEHEGIAEEGAQSMTPRKKKSKMNKRRFSDEQIRLLESIFESETKLEPRKKLQLARELGLQPRQVAIWFQNRRARWKSKQIEQDYRTLRDSYDNLASRFESLKKEKQSLIQQLQKLSELVAEPHDMDKEGEGMDGRSKIDGSDEHGDNKCEGEAEAQPIKVQLQQAAGLEDRGFLGLQIENEKQARQPVGEEFMSMAEGYRSDSPAAAATAASPEKLYGFDSSATLFDHSCTNSQWLNFWI